MREYVAMDCDPPVRRLAMPPANEPAPAQVGDNPSIKSEFLPRRREASTCSPTLQPMLPVSAGAQRVTSRARERTFSRVTSPSISPARRGTVEIFGTSFTAPGGCVIRGDSRTTRNRQQIALRGWLGLRRSHQAMRPRRLSSNRHLPRCG